MAASLAILGAVVALAIGTIGILHHIFHFINMKGIGVITSTNLFFAGAGALIGHAIVYAVNRRQSQESPTISNHSPSQGWDYQVAESSQLGIPPQIPDIIN